MKPFVGALLGDVLDGAMQIADVGHRLAHDLAVGLDDEADDAVGRRVLRTHVEGHLFAASSYGEDELAHVYVLLRLPVRRLVGDRATARACSARVVGMPRYDVGLAVVLAHRVAAPVVGHQDAPQIGMAGELDAEEIELLALVPVGRAPHVPPPTATRGCARGRSIFTTQLWRRAYDHK